MSMESDHITHQYFIHSVLSKPRRPYSIIYGHMGLNGEIPGRSPRCSDVFFRRDDVIPGLIYHPKLFIKLRISFPFLNMSPPIVRGVGG